MPFLDFKDVGIEFKYGRISAMSPVPDPEVFEIDGPVPYEVSRCSTWIFHGGYPVASGGSLSK